MGVAALSFRRRFMARRVVRDESGAAAVEFSLVALPFFAMLFAIVETSLSFFTSQVLETAVSDASRMIMTGQAQTTGMTQAQFRTQICNRLPSMFDCVNNLTVDVRPAADFSSADVSRPIVNGVISWTPMYNPGAAGDIIIVRVVYSVPTVTNIFGAALASTADGRMVLLATSSFRNEPYTNN